MISCLEKVTIPLAFKNRLKKLACEDGDLLEEELKEAKERCLHRHYRRIWQKLSKKERLLIKQKNPDRHEYIYCDAIGEAIK